MNKKYTVNNVKELPIRWFTFDQLSKINHNNNRVFNVCIDMTPFNERDVILLSVVKIHNHAHGNLVDPHFRAWVFYLNESRKIGLQDLTFEQWEMGEEIL